MAWGKARREAALERRKTPVEAPEGYFWMINNGSFKNYLAVELWDGMVYEPFTYEEDGEKKTGVRYIDETRRGSTHWKSLPASLYAEEYNLADGPLNIRSVSERTIRSVVKKREEDFSKYVGYVEGCP